MKMSDSQESCWDSGFVFSSVCEPKVIFYIRNSTVKHTHKNKLICVCKTVIIEYTQDSFRIAFAEQKLGYSPDTETKSCKQASALFFFLQVLWWQFWNKNQNGQRKLNPKGSP